jgi:hypothetical protein
MYPDLPKPLTAADLHRLFTPKYAERQWAPRGRPYSILASGAARQQCSVLVTMREQKKEHVMVVTTARSDDRLVRTTEGWRFAQRTMQADLDMAKVFARFASKSAAYDVLM